MGIMDSLSRAVNGHDGRFSSAAFGLSLTVFCIVIIIVNYPHFPQIVAKEPWIVEGTVLAIGILSSIGILVIFIQQGRYRLRRQINRDLTLRIKLVFLWIFGLLIIFSFCYDIAVNFDCLFRGKPISFKGQYEYGVVVLSLHIIFCFVQLGFLSSFAGHAPQISIAQNYMISFAILTHLVLWFLTFYKNIHSKTDPDMCFYNSYIANWRNKLQPLIQPAKIEFSLLAVELIVVIWIYSVDGDEENGEEFNYTGASDESTSLIRDSAGHSLSRKTAHRRLTITNTFYICILFGTLLSLPLIVSSVVLSYSSTYSLRNYNAFLITLLLLYAGHFILILATFIQMNIYSQWRNIKSTTITKNKSFVLILTMAGALCYSAFKIMVPTRMPNPCNSTLHGFVSFDSRTISTSLFKTLFEILTMFLQTLLIRQSWQMEKCAVPGKKQTVKRLLGTLCLINLIQWLVFSLLLGSQGRAMIIETCFYGETLWNDIHDGLFPVTMFYRFHTSMHFYECCRKYN
ncbi:proton channel OtopLc-like [Ostrea edulis]|uniref:proton channel OtopLc-like n=1 Tax=Ostrea edulis TaxID=37623 RepID=UPI00209491B7|nr:proton channel OtopLc-like [Ostrea edulis]